MRKYKVISPYRKRNRDGSQASDYATTGEVVALNDADAYRLLNARCIEEIETRVINIPENRKQNAGTDKRINNRTGKSGRTKRFS